MDFSSMNFPTHFSNLYKTLLSKTWPYAVWKTTSFCLFYIVLYGAFPSSCAGKHNEQSIPIHSLHALQFYWPLSCTWFSCHFLPDWRVLA